VVIDNGVSADTEACRIMPTWNAGICEGEFGRVAVRPAGGGGPGGGFGGGPGGPGGGASAAPSSPPITLVRNGGEFNLGNGGETTLRSGVKDLKVVAENPSLTLSMRQMEKGSWVIFELPGYTSASSGTEQGSLEALHNAGATSYYRSDDALFVKLVVEDPQAGGGGPMGGTNVVVSR
jgi:hypothetical protein